jgi:hypothetical protein
VALPANLRHRRAFHLGRVGFEPLRSASFFAGEASRSPP